MNWNSAQLKPYAKYLDNENEVDDMFGGFIFDGIRVRDNRYMYPLFVSFGEPADITDWLMWADALFLQDLNLNALAQVAGTSKRDVWVSIPYPHPFQKSFGFVGNRNLDFQLEDDRLAAVQWWLDQFLNRWHAQTHLHDKLDFRGFVWQRGAVDAQDENLIVGVNLAIRKKGYLSMWLPNYGSCGVIKWQKWGFDITTAFPNYTGHTNYDSSWISNASTFAAAFHTGLQLVWGKGLLYNDRHPLDYWNKGLPDNHGYMEDCYLVYHFPNQRLDQLYQTSFIDVVRLYTFIKGLYQQVDDPAVTS